MRIHSSNSIFYLLVVVTTTLLFHINPFKATMVNSQATTDMAICETEPVTRIACFKFRSSVSASQKGDRTRAFLNLYAQHQDLILGMPKGGRPLDTPLELTNVTREKGWDTGFIVKFKSETARKEFDADPGHDQLKEETDPLLEKVFVYDFVEQEGLGW